MESKGSTRRWWGQEAESKGRTRRWWGQGWRARVVLEDCGDRRRIARVVLEDGGDRGWRARVVPLLPHSHSSETVIALHGGEETICDKLQRHKHS